MVQLTKELKVSNKVHFHGYIKNPYPYYKFADLFVLSSKWEGLPNVVLESLFLKTPVVVTNCIPYLGKIIKSGKNGYIVEYGDYQSMANAILGYQELRVDDDQHLTKDINMIVVDWLR